MSGVVSGLILAAGTSSRLGEQTKQLLPWQDTTMLGWVVRRAEASLLDDVVVVVGHEAEAIRRHVALQRARFVEAPDFHEGCTSSIRAGLEALHPQSEAVVLILGDQPGIESETHRGCRRGVATHADADCARLVSRSLGTSDALCQGAVRTTQALHGDKGVWKLCDAHPEWVHEVKVDQPYPGDVNTWEDYTRLTSASPA